MSEFTIPALERRIKNVEEIRLATLLTKAFPDKRKRIVLWTLIPAIIQRNEHKLSNPNFEEELFNLCKNWLEKNYQINPPEEDKEKIFRWLRSAIRWWLKKWEERKAKNMHKPLWRLARCSKMSK